MAAHEMKWEIYRDEKGEYRTRLRGRNGKVIWVTGDGYKQRRGARSAINAMKDAWFDDAPVVEVK